MRILRLVFVALLVTPQFVWADEVAVVTLEDVASRGPLDDPLNEVIFWQPELSESLQIGRINWDGIVIPTPDPADPALFPSWGQDLGARLTHEATGISFELPLGTGFEMSPEGTRFNTFSRDLNGLILEPGDTLSLEFFEYLDDPEVTPDAIWETLRLSLDDAYVPELAPPDAGVIRFDTQGLNTFPTGANEIGGQFFGVYYGAMEVGPAIETVVWNTRANPRGVWFDVNANATGNLSGEFQPNVLQGLTAPTTKLEYENRDRPEGDQYAVLRLDFAAGDFTPGDAFRFGHDTDSLDFEELAGDQVADQNPPWLVTALLADGTFVQGTIGETRRDIPHASVVDLQLADRVHRGDFNQDGDVDGADLLQALTHFSSRSATHELGDTEGNGNVSRADLAIALEQYGRRSMLDPPPAAGRAVPEPAANTILALIALLGGIWRGILHSSSYSIP